jgi:aminodeoxyfutalosine deaminase
LYEQFGYNRSPFQSTGLSSLQTWLPHFTEGQTILLVHNTFTSEADIEFADLHASKYGLQLYYCLCPNANLYIEGRMPPVDLFMKKNVNLVVGTDSYVSNYQLSVLAELKQIRDHFSIGVEEMLKWVTSVPAAAAGWKNKGSFTRGATPGVVLLKEDDLSVQRII